MEEGRERKLNFIGFPGQNTQEEAAREVGSADRKWHVGRTIKK